MIKYINTDDAVKEVLKLYDNHYKGTLDQTIHDIFNAVLRRIRRVPAADVVKLPCKVGDTVYGQIENYGKQIHECKVVKFKVCQFENGSFHYFLDAEFNIIDPFFNDGRQMRCCSQVVFGEDFGSWDRVYLTREEAEAALVESTTLQKKWSVK